VRVVTEGCVEKGKGRERKVLEKTQGIFDENGVGKMRDEGSAGFFCGDKGGKRGGWFQSGSASMKSTTSTGKEARGQEGERKAENGRGGGK